jgi:hypothetical protein
MSSTFQYPFNPIPWGGIPHDYTGDNQLGIYTTETTQRFVYGTRYTTWDGRVFKYYNAVAACYSYHGAGNAEPACVTYVVAPTSHAAGQNKVTVTLGSRTEDDLAGSYLILYDKSSTDGNLNFGIIGNSDTATTTDIYLDSNLPVAVVAATDYWEVFENPYRELTEATDSYAFWAGVPMRNCAAGYKGWLQTWGPIVVSGGENVGAPSADTRLLRWGSNASVFTESTKANAQIAGCIMTGSSAAYGPLIMLQCST